jgi:hypothetical protein
MAPSDWSAHGELRLACMSPSLEWSAHLQASASFYAIRSKLLVSLAREATKKVYSIGTRESYIVSHALGSAKGHDHPPSKIDRVDFLKPHTQLGFHAPI